MRDVEIVAVCYIFIGIFGVIGNGMIVISLGKFSRFLLAHGQDAVIWLAEPPLKILKSLLSKNKFDDGR